jgi:hypothetical protein
MFRQFNYYDVFRARDITLTINLKNKSMKRLLMIIVAAGLMISPGMAQENLFLKGEKVLNIGIGLGSTLYAGSYFTGTFPPLSISFEKGIADEILEKGVIGVGGYLGYSAYKYEYFDWGYKYSDIILGARGSFHYPLLEKLDTYTGLLAGYELILHSEFGSYEGSNPLNAAGGGIVWSWYVGGRYYFSEKMAAMAELGYGISYLTLGISIKL